MSDYSKGIIYSCKCSEDKRIYYGSTINLERRIGQHKYDSKTSDYKLYKAIREYGWDKFTFEIVERFNCSSRDELERREFDYIEKCSPDDLFNMEVKFGELSEETKRVFSEVQKGNKNRFKGGSVYEDKTQKRWNVEWLINSKRHYKTFSYGPLSVLTRENAQKTAIEFKANLVF